MKVKTASVLLIPPAVKLLVRDGCYNKNFTC